MYYPRLAFDLTDGRALGKQSGIVSPRELYLEAVYGIVHVGIGARMNSFYGRVEPATRHLL